MLVLSMMLALCACGSPESNFKKAEEKTLENALDGFFEYYDQIKENADASQSLSTKNKVKVRLGKSTAESLTQMLGMDIAWVNDLQIDLSTVANEKQTAFNAKLSYMSNPLVSMAYILDMANEKMYLGIPEFFSKYLELPLEGADAGFSIDTASIIEKLPDAKTLRGLIEKYVGMILDAIPEVKEEKGTLTIDDVSENCTVYTVELTQKDVITIARDVMKAATEDPALETIIRDFVQLYNDMIPADYIGEKENADEIVANIKEGMTEMIEDANEMLASEDEEDIEELAQIAFKMTTYANKKSEILAQDIQLITDGEIDMEFFGGTATNGDRIASQIYVSEFGYKLAEIQTDMTAKSGILAGTVEILLDDTTFCYIEVEDLNTKLDKNSFNGTFTVKPAEGMVDMMSTLFESFDIPASMAYGFSVKLGAESNAKNASIDLCLMNGTEEIFGVNISSENTNETEITIPAASETVSVDRLLNTFDHHQLIDNIQASGLPEDVVSALIMLVNSIVTTIFYG